MSFEYKDIIIKLDKLPGESNKLYYKKGFSVAKEQPKTSEEFQTILMKNNIKLNELILGVKY